MSASAKAATKDTIGCKRFDKSPKGEVFGTGGNRESGENAEPRKLSEGKVENARCRMDGTTDEHESTRMGFERKATEETEKGRAEDATT